MLNRKYIHREGYKILALIGLVLLLLNAFVRFGASASSGMELTVAIISLIIFTAALSFFRNPDVVIDLLDNRQILAPADGKIVVVEQTDEPEYFKDKRVQVSIFMSPANVHVNRTPISGKVKYTKYHPGAYLVAWHPKSSTLNERYTSVIECPETELEVLVRQVAGKLAKKISNYLDEGEEVLQGEELGFIKFGSRVDLFLPLDANIKVSLNQKVKGGKTVIATLSGKA